VRVLVLSVLHLEEAPFAIDRTVLKKIDAVVLAGDISPGSAGIGWARREFADVSVIYVAGNHEFFQGDFDRTLDDLREAGHRHEVHFLENEPVTVGKVRFLGCTLWTDFNYFGEQYRDAILEKVVHWMPDYSEISVNSVDGTSLLRPHHTLRRHLDSLAWLEHQLSIDTGFSNVVVTHHFVNKRSCARIFAKDIMTAAFGSNLDLKLLRRASMWIHGHTHSSSNYRIGDSRKNVRVICNPRGAPFEWLADEFENQRFDPRLCMELSDDGHWGTIT
jgi:predicted phosphodiesterase